MTNRLTASIATTANNPGASLYGSPSPEQTGQHLVDHFTHQLHQAVDSCRESFLTFTSNMSAVGSCPAEGSYPKEMLSAHLTWEALATHFQGTVAQTTAEAEHDVIQFGNVWVDFTSRDVQLNGQYVAMTHLEFNVLKFFVQHPNRVFSRNQLLENVWGYNSYPSTRTVDNMLSKLRRKLEADSSVPTHFLTVHGTGYKFMP